MAGALLQQVLADVHGCTHAVVGRDTEGGEQDRLGTDPTDQRVCTIGIGEAEADREYVAAVFDAPGTDAVSPDSGVDPMALLGDIVAAHDSWRNCSDTCEALSVRSDSVRKARLAVRNLALP